MSTDISTVSPEDNMDEVAGIMGALRIGSMIVINYQTPVGIVTERDLLSKILALGKDPKNVKVKEVMSYPLISICVTARIREAAQMMMSKKGKLAVFECGNLVGIVTASDLIQSLPETPKTLVKINDFMTKKVITADEKTMVTDLVKTMGKKRIGSIIITQKNKPIGIFTERDLLTKFLAKDRSLNVTASEAFSSPLVTVEAGISVHEVAHKMATKKVRRMPVFKEDSLVGIITARDLVEAYAK